MKKLYLLIFTLLLAFASVNALSLITSQDANLYDYKNDEKGNFLFFDVVGSYSTTHTDSYFEINGTNYTFDKKVEFSALNQPFYIVVNNQIPNSTFTIMWQGDLSIDGTRYIQPFTLNQQGKYYFKLEPQVENEPASLWFDYNEAGLGQINIIENKPMGFSNAMSRFIEAFTTIISINTALWQIMFYSVIFTLSIGFLFILFGLAFTIFAYAKRMRENKMKRYNAHEHDRE